MLNLLHMSALLQSAQVPRGSVMGLQKTCQQVRPPARQLTRAAAEKTGSSEKRGGNKQQRQRQPQRRQQQQQEAAEGQTGPAGTEQPLEKELLLAQGFGDDPPGHRAGFVALIGRPNAGKSTLMNSLLGQTLSIVTPKAQTTRHRVLGVLSDEGHQVVFLDTPGVIQDRRNRLEERMMRSVQEAVSDADAVLAIVDASRKPQEALAMLQPGPDWDGPPMAVVLNKMDLLPPGEAAELQAWFGEHCAAERTIPISALEGTNTRAVLDWVLAKMPEGPSMYPKDYVAEASERFFVSEIIRRHVFLQYRQELPYCVAVDVVDYKERTPPAKDFVEAHIVVEHDRQRGIVLGKGGAALKRLATAAREEIEEFVGRQVYLALTVKVAEGWRTDAKQLARLGY